MSQLVKAIKALDSPGKKVVINNGLSKQFKDVFSGTHKFSTEMGIGTQYRIEARFGVNCITSDELLSDSFGEVLTLSVERAKRQVIEAIFGEFRPHFRRIEHAIYNHDIVEAAKLLHEMEEQMFTVADHNNE